MAGHLLASLFVLLVAACAEPPDAPFCEPGLPCLVASPEHCAAGLEAHLYGRATFADGTCAATDDNTCASASVTCGHFG
ncbi:MAG TPA: hypothetical protein PK095_14880, partial [Myxococcota bacterium]|nr:hypothetical protein [Myxococcota bacterium]